MRFSELELQRFSKRSSQNLTNEEIINFSILNFIHCIRLNHDDFFTTAYNSNLYGDIDISFKKKPEMLIGYCTAFIKSENKMYVYLFTDEGFEVLDDVIMIDNEEL